MVRQSAPAHRARRWRRTCRRAYIAADLRACIPAGSGSRLAPYAGPGAAGTGSAGTRRPGPRLRRPPGRRTGGYEAQNEYIKARSVACDRAGPSASAGTSRRSAGPVVRSADGPGTAAAVPASIRERQRRRASYPAQLPPRAERAGPAGEPARRDPRGEQHRGRQRGPRARRTRPLSIGHAEPSLPVGRRANPQNVRSPRLPSRRDRKASDTGITNDERGTGTGRHGSCQLTSPCTQATTSPTSPPAKAAAAAPEPCRTTPRRASRRGNGPGRAPRRSG